MRLLQRLFTSKRLILLTVELNGERTNEKDEHTHKKNRIRANNLFTLSHTNSVGLERHFQIGFFF